MHTTACAAAYPCAAGHARRAAAAACREAGDWLGAVQHYMAMVLCPANSLYCQRAYLAQFLDVLRAARGQLVRAWLAKGPCFSG